MVWMVGDIATEPLARSITKRGPGGFDIGRGEGLLACKLALVMLVVPFFFGFPKSIQLSQPPMMGYVLAVSMSCNGELALF